MEEVVTELPTDPVRRTG